ncbi:MAG: hypothetical protein JW963_08925 [Anaerolineales bacterium]|nr:hypothetical protein [Anaerolineales bacterium]
MKRILVLTLFLSWLLLPIPSPGNKGTFNQITGIRWCSDLYSCLHEQAHFIDKSNNWISQSQEFKEALQIYLISELQFNTDKRAYQVAKLAIGGGDVREIYADLYSLFGGNVPESLREFYLVPNTRECEFWLPVGKVVISIPRNAPGTHRTGGTGEMH